MKKIIVILTLIIVISIVSILLLLKSKPLNIYFFSVDKSDSILITYNDKVILIDTSLNSYSDKIINYLNKKNIKTIDYLIITHFDKDHVGGASKIIDNFDIKNVYQSSYIKNSDYYLNYINSLNKKGINPNIIENNYSFNIEDLEFIIYGTNKIYENDTSNNSSLVVSLKYKNNSFLFTGDIEEDRISDFINEELIKYDVIKMPHHGNYHKGLEELINKINVKYAVITHNIKDDKTINMLDNKKVKYYLTTKNILISSDGKSITIRYVD